MSERDKRILEEIINSDATLRAMFTTRDPRYRYWQTPDGRMFLYTTERFSDGKFGSAVLVPYGPGARSGRRRVSGWRTSREVHHARRKDARARAYRLYSDWVLILGGRALQKQIMAALPPEVRAERFGSEDPGEVTVTG